MDLPGSSAPPSNPLPTDRTFTGQEQDGTGLMYYRSRFFDPALGTLYYYGSRATAVVMRDTVDTSTVRMLNWQQQDDLGRLAKTVNYTWNGTTWVTDSQVQLSYDGADNLIKTERRDGSSGPWVQLSSLTYDLLGRKTAMSDADLGAWSYAYDKRGNLTRQTDARGKTTCLAYDPMGRLDKKYAGTISNCDWSTIGLYYNSDIVYYTYDNRSQLTQVTAPGVSHSYTYNARGLVEGETVTIDGMAKTATTGYDTYNRPNQLTYPDGEIVTTSFNSMGLPRSLHSSVAGYLVGASSATSADNAKYDAAGRLLSMKYPAGGNLWRTQTYYPWTTQRSGGLLNEIKVGTTNGGTDRLYRQYSYNSFGDVFNDGTGVSNFTYDSLDRLTSAYGQTFEYWATGRFKTFAGQSYGYDDPGPYHAVDRINNVDRYDYDANGNMTVRNKGLGTQQQTLEWNAENRLATVKNNTGGVIESYAYDADGSRVKTTSSGVITRTFFPFYEEENGVAVKYYTFNGQRIAVRRGGTLSYLHTDHLGSSSLATDASGNAIPVNSQGVRYYAYGAVRSGDPVNLQTDRTFTGQKADSTGLMFYEARYYDGSLGIFLSPDTIVPEPGVVFDYNRYMYVRGNPLKYNDPSGHCAFDENGNISKFDCTVDDFHTLSWEDRIKWVNAFVSSNGLEDWFNDIRGVISDTFVGDNTFEDMDGYVAYMDAAVLQAINDGWQMEKGKQPVGTGGLLWAEFFKQNQKTLKDNKPSLDNLRLDAEQFGVDYARSLPESQRRYSQESIKDQIKIDVFLFGADTYRRFCPCGPVNPRDGWPILSKLGGVGKAFASYLYASYTTGTTVRYYGDGN